MRASAILVVVGCCVVLGGAFFASRMLVSEVAVPAPTPVEVLTMVAPPAEVSAAAPVPAPQAPPVDRAAHEAMLAPHQGLLQPVNAAPGYPRLVEAGNPPAAPPAEVASPFKGESRELDYAELLLTDPTPNLEKVRSAYEVMSRCTEQEPDNKRCQDGLALAKSLLSAPTTTQLKPLPPTLQTQPPQQLRPALHLK